MPFIKLDSGMEFQSIFGDDTSPSKGIKAILTITNHLNGPDVKVNFQGDLIATVQSNDKIRIPATIGQTFDIAIQGGHTQIVKVTKKDEFLVIDADSLKASIENQDLATNNAIRLYPLSGNRNIAGLKSLKSETVAFITFYNLTAQSVDVSWINFAGNRQLYKTLGTYDNYRQQTYVTHPWEIIIGGRSSVFLPTAGIEYYVFIGATDKPTLVPLSGCGGLKSPPSVLATTVEFVNNSTNDASIFWINFVGGLNFYKTVKSGEKYTQNTFVGHLWQVVASNGSKTCYASIDSDANVLI